jgi:hypothetical protein
MQLQDMYPVITLFPPLPGFNLNFEVLIDDLLECLHTIFLDQAFERVVAE